MLTSHALELLEERSLGGTLRLKFMQVEFKQYPSIMFPDIQDIFQQKGICSQRDKINKVLIYWKKKKKKSPKPKPTQHDWFSSFFEEKN